MGLLDINTVTVTNAATRVQFSASSVPFRRVEVIARRSNGSNIYVGTSSVTSVAGIELHQGEKFQFSPPNGHIFLYDLYADSDINNDAVDYVAYAD